MCDARHRNSRHGQTWAVVLIVIGLLSGALSVTREMQVMYAPTKDRREENFLGVGKNRFSIAQAVLLSWDEHSKVGKGH